MRNSFAMAAALATGIGIGSFGVHALHAQAKPPVYMIEDNTVIDPAGFAKEFAPLARESLKTYGGRNLGGGSGISMTETHRRDASFSSDGTRSIKC
jgi:hypothetical protein